jgi:hypothetical protein
MFHGQNCPRADHNLGKLSGNLPDSFLGGVGAKRDLGAREAARYQSISERHGVVCPLDLDNRHHTQVPQGLKNPLHCIPP